MRETNMEKIQNTTHGSGCFEHCTPPEQSTSAALSRLLRFGAVVLIVGAVLLLCASMAVLYLWKASDKNVYNVRYSMNINGEVRPGAVEIDSDNNLERFKTGSGAEEAVEIHDFQIGITGIRFFGGGKCYIKSQIKASLPHMGAHKKESLMFDLTDEVIPMRFDEEFLVWVSAEQPLKDTSFLSDKILGLCGELPIYWLQPVYPKGHRREPQLCRIELRGHVYGVLWMLTQYSCLSWPAVTDGERRKRDAQRAKRQFNMEESEAAAGERNPVSHEEDDTSRVVVEEEEEEEGGVQSAAGSAFNPENPYHRGGGAREEGAMTFDTMLDHQGICCSECQRGYTHCQRICEPLRGHWPWPYNYRGCQVACRVIMPCRWWVARILGLV